MRVQEPTDAACTREDRYLALQIAVQLPAGRENALRVLGLAGDVVRDWLEVAPPAVVVSLVR